MRYFRVRNWKRFQHYSNRAPVWIKLYTDMIEDQNGDWAGWTDAQRGQIVGIWQLAAKLGNCIPYDSGFVESEIMATGEIDLEAFGGHFDVYPSKRACFASDIAIGSMVRCSSSSLSRSSSSESECVPTKKQIAFAESLLKRHGLSVDVWKKSQAQLTLDDIDEIVLRFKDGKPSVGARVPSGFPADPDMTAAERAESDRARAETKEAT